MLEWIRITQHMHWKHMAVRGEVEVEEGEERVFEGERGGVEEIEDMSQLAQICREKGLDSLFLTSMKIYNSEDEKEEKHSEEVVK